VVTTLHQLLAVREASVLGVIFSGSVLTWFVAGKVLAEGGSNLETLQ